VTREIAGSDAPSGSPRVLLRRASSRSQSEARASPSDVSAVRAIRVPVPRPPPKFPKLGDMAMATLAEGTTFQRVRIVKDRNHSEAPG
jgi:hypothetical protein